MSSLIIPVYVIKYMNLVYISTIDDLKLLKSYDLPVINLSSTNLLLTASYVELKSGKNLIIDPGVVLLVK